MPLLWNSASCSAIFSPMATVWVYAWLLCFTNSALSLDRRQDPLDSCTQTDLALLDECVASAIDSFLATLDTLSFDYSAVASSINSLADDLTSYGVTLSTLPDPATFTGVDSTYSGPYVSDIVSSYSEYTATRTGTDGSTFSFDATSFQATRSTTETSTSSEATETTFSPSETSTSPAAVTSASETADSGSCVRETPYLMMGLLLVAIGLVLT